MSGTGPDGDALVITPAAFALGYCNYARTTVPRWRCKARSEPRLVRPLLLLSWSFLRSRLPSNPMIIASFPGGRAGAVSLAPQS